MNVSYEMSVEIFLAQMIRLSVIACEDYPPHAHLLQLSPSLPAPLSYAPRFEAPWSASEKPIRPLPFTYQTWVVTNERS